MPSRKYRAQSLDVMVALNPAVGNPKNNPPYIASDHASLDASCKGANIYIYIYWYITPTIYVHLHGV